MPIPTEPIGSIPRTADLLAAMRAYAAGKISAEQLTTVEESALRDTISRLEETGSPVITDGEQTKPSFATYPLSGLEHLGSDGVSIPFADGHTRQLPKLTAGPFRYGVHAVTYLKAAQQHAHRPVKQAVISASALSLLYPQSGIDGYLRTPTYIVRMEDGLPTKATSSRPYTYLPRAERVCLVLTEGVATPAGG